VVDSATVALRGELTSAASAALRRVAGGGPAVLVLLDTADIRVCEDLGRQLRELHARSGPGLPLVVVADPAALVRLRTFTRREHLRPAGFVALAPGSVLADAAQAPTPAVLLTRAGSPNVVGVGHPRRFPNVRVRSFADELSAYLPAPAGEPSSTLSLEAA
jgi:hypothetical protein